MTLTNSIVTACIMTLTAIAPAKPAEQRRYPRRKDLRRVIERCPEHLFSTDSREMRTL